MSRLTEALDDLMAKRGSIAGGRCRLYIVVGDLAGNIPDKVPSLVKMAISIVRWKPCVWAFDASYVDERIAICVGIASYLPFFRFEREAEAVEAYH